jgi:muconolactone delta-isomerase
MGSGSVNRMLRGHAGGLGSGSKAEHRRVSLIFLIVFHFRHKRREMPMKYMLTWTERPQGSPVEYENAQKRILEIFTQWKAPSNFTIELFVIRVGDWGGYMLLDCDDPTAVHKFCSMLPAFVFEARPVIPIDDAVRVELESITFRDGLKRK